MKKRFRLFKDPARQVQVAVSLDRTVMDLLAIKIGKSAVRDYLQNKLDADPDPDRVHISAWLQKFAILEIADENLRETYWDRAIDNPESTRIFV